MYSLTVNTGLVALLGMLGISVENLQLRDELEYTVVRDFIASAETVDYHAQGRVREQHNNGSRQLAAARSGVMAAYPNPFNPVTTISVTLPEAGHVTLSVYNALGQEVARLADDQAEAGEHSFRWDASAVPSGLYFSRLEGPGVSSVAKLMLVK